MRVLVVKQVVGDDVRIVMVCRDPVMVSDVVTVRGAAWHHDGNPYGVYGEACEKFTGKHWQELNITVAEFTSGDVDQFLEGSTA